MTTAPMMLLEGSTQDADIKSSKAPSDIIRGYARIKTYVKSDDFRAMDAGRDMGIRAALPFDQPFQVASAVSGLDWNVTNRAFLGQVADCNLRCPYCYIGESSFRSNSDHRDEARTVEVSAQQYVDDFIYHNRRKLEESGKMDAGVLRYSGGEPFLFQKWLAESVEFASMAAPFVWVDTNLTQRFTNDSLPYVLAKENVAVCGCFKPGYFDIYEQLAIVEDIISAGINLFLYYPSYGGSDPHMDAVMKGLSDIHPNLPLRLWVIGIRWGYSAMEDRRDTVSEEDASASLSQRRRLWSEHVARNCEKELLYLPSHQVPIF